MKQNDAAVARATTPVTIRHAPLVRRADEQPVTITVTLERRFVPSTKAALNELRNLLAGRLENAGRYAWEDAQVNAHIGVSKLSAAFHAVCREEDRNYAG